LAIGLKGLISCWVNGKIKTKGCIVDPKVGDIYIRRSDGMIYSVKTIDHKKVVLESLDKNLLTVTDIFGLEKAYNKKNHKPNK
jgi:hypothetical protein